MPNENLSHWPSGARDTTEFPKVNIDIDVAFRDHLKAFTKMGGAGWTDYDAMNLASGSEMTGSRLRTYRKLYEKCGLIYRSDGKIQLSRLGQQMGSLEADLEAKKEEILDALRATAIDILSRYQLRNPSDNDPLPDDCDILPAICFWKAMRQLDNKLHAEEINRVILRVMRMADLDRAIEHIRDIRSMFGGKYESDESITALGEPVHTNQAQARIAPWFSFLGWGGLIIEQVVDSDGFRNLTVGSLPIIDKILANPPHYFDVEDELEWVAHYIGTENTNYQEDNETAFINWLATAKKANGSLYSENTRHQYVSALKAAANQFAGAIGPFTSVFEIADVETFDRAAAFIKADTNFDEFNRNRGNGSLSAGLDLYRRFLTEKNSGDECAYLSPAWFRRAAANYSQVDIEADALYQQFQAMYSPDKLRTLTDEGLLGYIFLGVNERSLCNALEFDAQFNQFGSIAGGTAYKYNLFYSRNDETWKTSFGEGGQRSISQEEALEIGKQIRDALIAGADVIAKHEALTTVNDYNNLLIELNAVIPQYITKMWFLKYYHMMFPHILPNFFNEAWQKHILCNLNIVPSDVQFIRMGQIGTFINECGISSIVFSKIIFDSIGSPKSFYRIGTGDNGTYFDEWHRENYVAVGWNELGDLTLVYQEDTDSKTIITDALKSQWNYDNRLASRKYGEINSFYSAVAETTYVVAMAGQKVLAIGIITGGYFFDGNKDYGHCRPVRWLKVFEEGKVLPNESEGKLTTFYELKNSENLCYLYALLHGADETVAYAEEEIPTELAQPINFSTGLKSDQPRNRVLFGAPGTGKSFTLNREKDALLAEGGEYERVTFHPDYSYANFVGTYKPVPCKDSDGKDAITYSYVPGPFMRTYVKALQNSRTDAPKPFLLVIEEINRANVAAVFGDVFQLLDRGDNEVSEYPIQASEDIKKYLARELGDNPDDYAEIRIPDNMFIWATMNSADQGVFPMDTAFKRRWDFTYLGIDDSEAGIVGKKVILGQGDYRRVVEWNALRKAINDELLTYKVNEDKLMGPYFISKKNLPECEMIDAAVFTRIFKNKVIMYLFDDAAKQKRITLFGGCDEKSKNQYSKICREFDTKGVYIFCEGISSQFIDNVPEDDGE